VSGDQRPPFEPWLGHLRRDRRGLPVPYINLWGEDWKTDNITVAYDPNVGREAVFVDDSAEPEPNFTRANPQRQRECWAAGLCQVCGRPVPWSRRNVVVSGISVEWKQVEGRQRAVISEPWLDDRCAHIATHWCPALIRRRRDEHLTVVPVRSKREAQLVVATGWVEGPLEAATKANPVALTCKLTLLTWDIQPAEALP
jgi:hypothetical protein